VAVRLRDRNPAGLVLYALGLLQGIFVESHGVGLGVDVDACPPSHLLQGILQVGISLGENPSNVLRSRLVVYALIDDSAELLVDVIGRALHAAVDERRHRVCGIHRAPGRLHLQHAARDVGERLSDRDAAGVAGLLKHGRQPGRVAFDRQLHRVAAPLLEHDDRPVAVRLQGPVQAFAEVLQPIGR
jgi:hypothetical protein